MKSLKFVSHLVPLVLSGEKTSTWRLFDDKDLKAGDELELIQRENGNVFAKAIIVLVREKKMKDLQDFDFSGHEKYESEEKMYKEYRSYYGNKVTPEAIIKIVDFKLVK